MKQLVLFILLAVLPLAFAGKNNGELQASPKWERNVAMLPEPVKETLAVAFPTYIIVEYARVARGDYKILLRSAEDAIYVQLNTQGDIVDEKGAMTPKFETKQRHIILF